MQLFKFFENIFSLFELLASNAIKMKVFIYIPGTIVIRSIQINWKHRSHLLIFSLDILNLVQSYRKYIKQQPMVAFVRNCLVKMALKLFQSISVVMTMVPMLLREFSRLAQGYCWSYANSLKQLILYLHLLKNIFSSLSPAYWRYKPGLFFFPDKKKKSNL